MGPVDSPHQMGVMRPGREKHEIGNKTEERVNKKKTGSRTCKDNNYDFKNPKRMGARTRIKERHNESDGGQDVRNDCQQLFRSFHVSTYKFLITLPYQVFF